jgi:hypothetical protein
MKTVKIILIMFAAATLSSCSGQTNRTTMKNIEHQQIEDNATIEKPMSADEALERYRKMSEAGNENKMTMDEQFETYCEILAADYGTCYTIGNYMLCPEKKLMRVGRMFGTAVADAFGYFPDLKLQYDQETMIIFAGQAFLNKPDFNIDWQTVKLLWHDEKNARFTAGKTEYHLYYGEVYRIDMYSSFPSKPDVKKPKRNRDGVKVLTEDFCVKGNKFYFGGYSVDDFSEGYMLTPILEHFDVPNLRTIVSEGGFETDYITDGRQVLFGGGKTGYSSTEKNGIEYVMAERWLIEGDVDFASLRVLGKDMLADKNALYCGTEIIPFAALNGFQFIIREIE